jgi:putative DNA primase/helicase
VTLSQPDRFEQVNRLALAAYPDLLTKWCPGGKVVGGKEYKALNPTRADKTIKSFSINIHNGKWGDFATGDEGGDPISLYAYLKCGGLKNRVEACKRLAEELGIDTEHPPEPPRKGKPKLKLVKADEWKPLPLPDPPPPYAKETGGWDHLFAYRTMGGKLLRYVARIDAKGDEPKKIRAITYGELNGRVGWHVRQPDAPRCLYGLERLGKATILLLEGELKADLVQAVVGTAYGCLSITGGTGQIEQNDLSALVGCLVIVCFDADAPGRKAAARVGELLRAIGCAVQLVDMTGMPPKWDLADAVKEGWDAKRITEFIEARSRDSFDEDSGDVDADVDLGEPYLGDEGKPAEKDKRRRPPIALGYRDGHYFYLSPMTGQIECLARRSHTKQELIGIASLEWFNTLEQFRGKEGGLEWDGIGNLLKGWCSDVGFFTPDKVRGRGAYLDVHRETGEVRAVLNVGDRLIVNGASTALMLPGSKFIYEAAPPLNYVEAPPLTKEQATEVAELCKLFSWEKPICATLMAGWLAVAPICGALFYRPAVWVTGGSGSGKSTLEALIVKPLLGDIAMFLKGGTTEAGVRQKLGHDARPLWFDEAEAESPKSKASLQGLLELNRQSSSEGGAEIIKGTQNQTGAKTYHVKSCFAFSGINPTLDHMADENRMSVLELTSHGVADPEDFDVRVVDRINRTMTPEFCAGFVARSVWLMPVTLDNAKTFSKAVAVHLGNSRIGDQVGVLLAGAFSEISDKRVSPEAARKWVEEQDWTGITSADAIPDERRLLNHLMQRRVRLDLGDNKFQDMTMGELVKIASGAQDAPLMAGVADKELRRHGLKSENGGIWISNTHTALKKHLEGTPWSSQWARSLRRLPGTKPLDREAPAIKFAGELGRATFVPIDLIAG